MGPTTGCSPVHADLRGLGRIAAFVGSRDLLLADARRLRRDAEQVAPEIEPHEYPGTFHNWIMQPLPEAAGPRRHGCGARHTGYGHGDTDRPRRCTVPQEWDDKRERQYQHIKEQTEQRGSSEKRAKEIASRTVNKDRAQEGESRQASSTSTKDVSPEHRGGKRSGLRTGPQGETKQQLYDDAKRAGVSGRSSMTKDQLRSALGY